MERELVIRFSRATEVAALVGYKWLNRGGKDTADGAVVNAMRIILDLVNIDGVIVTGEGEIDEVPMLYIDEKASIGKGDTVGIAVDPIEDTHTTATSQANVLVVMTVGDKGCSLNAPDMYMEKLIVSSDVKSAIDLSLPLERNLHDTARALNKPLGELTVTASVKPRHGAVVTQLQQLGMCVFATPDGDTAASILTYTPDSEIDALYSISGTPEGAVLAAVVRVLDGNIQGCLPARHHVGGDSEENRRIGENELVRYKTTGIKAGGVLRPDEAARSDGVVFSIAGIIKGDLLDGIIRKGNMVTTRTLLTRDRPRTIRRTQSIYYLDRKDPNTQQYIL